MKRSRENKILEPYLVNRLTGDNRRDVGGISQPSAPVTAMSTAPVLVEGAGETPPVTAEYTRGYLKLVKDTFKDSIDIHEEFIELLTDFRAGRIHGSVVAMKVKELFKGGLELLLGFNAFLSKEDKITLSPEEEQRQQFKRKQPANFEETINKVNKKFRISKEKIRSMWHVKPSKQGEKTPTFGERNRGVGESRGVCSQERIPSKLEKDQIKSNENEKYKEDDPQPRERGKASKQADRGKERKLHLSQSVSNKGKSVQLVNKLKPQAGYSGEALHRHDKEMPKKLVPDFNPSYRVRQKSYPKLLSTHCTELSSGILNDSWECVRPGREEYEEKPKNRHDENSFLCEDDRYELDMLVERTAATAKRVAELVNFIQDPKFKQQMSIFVLEEHLSIINLRCIETIYGDHGSKFIDSLRVSAALALPAVLLRLKQKLGEWSRYRVKMNCAMKEVYSKNPKSLDHTLYFKQQDKKKARSRS